MGRMYSASFEEVAVSVAQDLFEITAPSDACVIVHGFIIGQVSDVDSEMLWLRVHKAGGASGSGGTTPTPSPLQVGDSAFGGVVDVNNTTQNVGGGATVHTAAFNVLAGYTWMPLAGYRPKMTPGWQLVVALDNAPADELTMSGTIYFEEVAA